MKIEPGLEIWLPRSQQQMKMTAEEVQVDNYCRKILQTLNKATPQNIDSLLDKMAELNVNNEFNINKLVHYIVRKAEDEILYGEVYAEMCCCLNPTIDRAVSSDSVVRSTAENSLSGSFKAKMHQECHQEFHKIFNYGKLEDCALKREIDSLQGTYDELHVYRQTMFGIVSFIGQLFKAEFLDKDMLVKYINDLLEKKENKSSLEFQMECLCKLLRTVGLRIECEQGKKDVLDECFLKIDKIQLENTFCSRVKFAILDITELRQNNWIDRRSIEMPTTIDEIRNSHISNGIKVIKKKKKKKKKN